jgi:hypothetical protein
MAAPQPSDDEWFYAHSEYQPERRERMRRVMIGFPRWLMPLGWALAFGLVALAARSILLGVVAVALLLWSAASTQWWRARH